MKCLATKLGVTCPSHKGPGHEHFGTHPLGLARWWDGEDGLRVNSKHGDGGVALKVTPIELEPLRSPE
jgi:hypothetical protein